MPSKRSYRLVRLRSPPGVEKHKLSQAAYLRAARKYTKKYIKSKRSGRKSKRSGRKSKRSGRKSKRSGRKSKRSGRRSKRSGRRSKRSGRRSKRSGRKSKRSYPVGALRRKPLLSNEIAKGTDGCYWRARNGEWVKNKPRYCGVNLFATSREKAKLYNQRAYRKSKRSGRKSKRSYRKKSKRSYRK